MTAFESIRLSKIDKVIWRKGCFNIGEEYMDFVQSVDIEVIGNVFDDPELLEVVNG
jgi:hypothetical protein